MAGHVTAALARYFTALDGRDWSTCLDSFCPAFDADYTSMVGGEPFKGLPREANMPAWSGMMAGFLSTRHVVVPSSIEVDEAAGTASLAASVTASHVLPPAEAGGADRLWTTTGAYAMKWERGADDAVWRIRALTYKQTSSEPADPSAFIEEAKSRATAAAAPAAAEAAPAASA